MSRTKIIPEGQKIIVLPSTESGIYETEAGISVLQNDLIKGVVVEISPELEDRFKGGDTVIFPKGAGIGQMYKNKPHLWLNVANGDVWGKLVNEKLSSKVAKGE